MTYIGFVWGFALLPILGSFQLLRVPAGALLRLGNVMDRFAIFVDAGYLFAQGSAAIAGAKQPRENLELEPTSVVEALTKIAGIACPDAKLLRIYWYDGVRYSGPTLEHKELAHTNDIKVRLGFVNSAGQQKGVDSLIVTDLIELGRNSSIADAVLVSGDEDVRIGVQIAQSYGVRVHLLGIQPARGSQSDPLMQEADTTHELSGTDVEAFLKVKAGAESARIQNDGQQLGTAKRVISTTPDSERNLSEFGKSKDLVVAEVIGAISPTDLARLKKEISASSGVPSEFDGKLLGKCRDALGRDLDVKEKSSMRTAFRNKILGV